MNRKEIERVKSFSVENEHAKLLFIGETDLTGLDIDKLSTFNLIFLVEIEAKSVEVYP